MPKLPKGFNPKKHDDMNDYTPIPKGEYPAAIKKSEMKPTKSNKDGENDNEYLQLDFHILSGDYKGKVIFVRLNLVNENAVAVDIANKELATICRACEISDPEDSEELHGIAMTVEVAIEPGNGDRADQNKITMYTSGDDAPKGKKDKKAEKKDPPHKGGNKGKKEVDDDDDDDIDLSDLEQADLVSLAVTLDLGKKMKLRKKDTADLIDMIEECDAEDIEEALDELDLI